MQQPFIIIGMHRSGTTFLANALNDAGIFMGVIRDSNGEAMHFLSLNQQMLAAEKASWLAPKVPSEVNQKTLPAHVIYAEHLKSQSSNKLKLQLLYNKSWGWKDPRNTYTLAHWLKIFPKAKVIHVIRDGRKVALSLKKRNKVVGEVHDQQIESLAFNFNLWQQYVAEGKKWQSVLKDRYFEIKYEDLIAKKDKPLADLEHFTAKNVSSFLKPHAEKMNEIPSELNDLAMKNDLFLALGYASK